VWGGGREEREGQGRGRAPEPMCRRPPTLRNGCAARIHGAAERGGGAVACRGPRPSGSVTGVGEWHWRLGEWRLTETLELHTYIIYMSLGGLLLGQYYMGYYGATFASLLRY
jgi:hypothetical protein